MFFLGSCACDIAPCSCDITPCPCDFGVCRDITELKKQQGIRKEKREEGDCCKNEQEGILGTQSGCIYAAEKGKHNVNITRGCGLSTIDK